MNRFKWYILKVVSGQENKIKLYINLEVLRNNLTKYVNEILVPYEKVYKIIEGKKKVKKKNFFPGYILIYADLSYNEIIYLIKKSPGVLGFLNSSKHSNNPEPVRQFEINRILIRLNKSLNLKERLEKPFIIGEMVKVINGPFNGYSGSIREIFEDRKKLNVMVKIFGRNTPIELSYIQVEKIF